MYYVSTFSGDIRLKMSHSTLKLKIFLKLSVIRYNSLD